LAINAFAAAGVPTFVPTCLPVGIVVFLVRAAPGELDLPRRAVPGGVVIDEFRAVVGVEAAEHKGERLAPLLHGRGYERSEDRP